MFTRLIGLALVGCALSGQSTKAELFGVVSDPSGRTVGAAVVQLTNLGTGSTSASVSDASGTYHFAGLPAGAYQLSVQKDGFATLRRGEIAVRVGDQLGVDLRLQIGDVAQSAVVTADASLLQTARGTTAFVVEQKKVVSLPLDGRNFVPLIALSPGVNLPPGNLLPRINGSRPRVSEYIYDGISVLQPEPGQVAFYPIVDAIAEFRVETNSYSMRGRCSMRRY